MSWTIDARCTQCANRTECPDKPELYSTLSPLTNKLNMEEPHASGLGNGIIIVSCADFSVAPRD